MSSMPLSLFALLSVAACAPVASHESPPGSGDDAAGSAAGAASEDQILVAPGIGGEPCNADAAQRFIGRTPDEATVTAARAASGATAVRVLTPEMMVTMEFRGDRLNLRVGSDGRIASVTCG